MPSAPLTVGLPSQTHQGGGARLLRRLGGAVRTVIAGGSALARGLRRPAAPQSRRAPPAPRGPAAPPAPKQPRAPRRPRAASSVQLPQAARSGWMARWFGRNRRQPALDSQPPLPDSDDAPFTPEVYPGLSPEVCAFLNTPVEECDPDLMRVVLAMLARHIADSMPPELGMDVEALFSTLYGRLGAEPGEAGADAPPAEEPSPAPATLTAASPTPEIESHGTEPAEDAVTATSVATVTTSDAASPAGPGVRRNRSPFDRGLPFRRRSLAIRCRSPFRRSFPRRSQPPLARRLCYAACAGPP